MPFTEHSINVTVCARVCVCAKTVQLIELSTECMLEWIYKHNRHIPCERITEYERFQWNRGIGYCCVTTGAIVCMGKGDVTFTVANFMRAARSMWAKSTFHRHMLGGLLCLIKNCRWGTHKKKNDTETNYVLAMMWNVRYHNGILYAPTNEWQLYLEHRKHDIKCIFCSICDMCLV